MTMIPNDWLGWVDENVRRGCTQSSMLELMVKAGFDKKMSNQAIVDATLKFEAGAAPLVVADRPYVYEKSYLKAGNHIKLFDKTVDVAFRIKEPDAALIHNLLSAEECQALIKAATPKLKASKVVNNEGGGMILNEGRTSEGTYFNIRENDLIISIEKRIEALVGFPIVNGEGLQILHYGPGAEYRPHYDYFNQETPGGLACTKKGGQRVITLIIYLNDVEEGGETTLPEINFSVSPQRGSAFYFAYLNSLGQVDKKTFHASLPVTKGEKWVATKWIRERNYNE
jgi:prolyl 4-hydroxylase